MCTAAFCYSLWEPNYLYVWALNNYLLFSHYNSAQNYSFFCCCFFCHRITGKALSPQAGLWTTYGLPILTISKCKLLLMMARYCNEGKERNLEFLEYLLCVQHGRSMFTTRRKICISVSDVTDYWAEILPNLYSKRNSLHTIAWLLGARPGTIPRSSRLCAFHTSQC